MSEKRVRFVIGQNVRSNADKSGVMELVLSREAVASMPIKKITRLVLVTGGSDRANARPTRL
jgi:hypothetical protein